MVTVVLTRLTSRKRWTYDRSHFCVARMLPAGMQISTQKDELLEFEENANRLMNLLELND